MAMGAVEQGETLKGVTTIFGYAIPTTGVFGLSGDADSGFHARGFPWWTTLPGHRDLAMGRRWHFFFAWLFLLNGLAYLLWSLGKRPSSPRSCALAQRAQAYRRLDP